MRNVVVNSSPLIALSGIFKLNVLHELYGEIMIPSAVYEEISAKPKSACKEFVDEFSSWIHICPIKNIFAKKMFKAKLHEGEVEAMILAQEQNSDLLIIDDALAKKHAIYLGINVTGTLGVLIKAYKERIIDDIEPLLRKMQRNNIYISEQLISYCLQECGKFYAR